MNIVMNAVMAINRIKDIIIERIESIAAHWNDNFAIENVEADGDDLVLKKQYALEFDGEDDYVDVGHASELEFGINDAFSIEGQFYIDGEQTTALFSKYDATTTHSGYICHLANNKLYWGLRKDLDFIRIVTDNNLPHDEWLKIKAVYDGSGSASGLSIYINDVLADTSISNDEDISNVAGGYPFTIGARDAGDSWFFEGRIAWVTVHDGNDNLVAYWPMQEGSGTTAYDESTNNNDGTINGATWTVSGLYYSEGNRTSPPLSLDSIKYVTSSEISWTSTEPIDTNITIECAVAEEQYALEFDGTDDYVKVDNDASLTFDITEGFEAVANIKMNDISGGDTFSDDNPRYVFCKAGTSVTDINYSLRILGGKLQFVARDSTDSHYISVSMDNHEIETGIWYEVKVEHTGTQIKLYIDGIEKKSVDNTDANRQTTDDLFIGRQGAGDRRYFDGLITNLKITHNTNIKANWLMNEGSGTTVYDESTNNNDGTIYNATWTEKEPFDEDYTEATSGQSIPGISANDDLTGKYLWVRQTLNTDVNATSKLNSLTTKVEGKD